VCTSKVVQFEQAVKSSWKGKERPGLGRGRGELYGGGTQVHTRSEQSEAAMYQAPRLEALALLAEHADAPLGVAAQGEFESKV